MKRIVEYDPHDYDLFAPAEAAPLLTGLSPAGEVFYSSHVVYPAAATTLQPLGGCRTTDGRFVLIGDGRWGDVFSASIVCEEVVVAYMIANGVGIQVERYDFVEEPAL